MNQKDRNELLSLWNDRSLSYIEPQSIKAQALRKGISVLRSFATDFLGLKKEHFDVRKNEGGIAVSGEVTLHTQPLPDHQYGIYIQLSQGWSLPIEGRLLIRSCKHAKDYTGGQNNHCTLTEFFRSEEDVERLRDFVRKLCVKHDLSKAWL